MSYIADQPYVQPFLRVLAIAVQGSINRKPHRNRELEDIASYIRVKAYGPSSNLDLVLEVSGFKPAGRGELEYQWNEALKACEWFTWKTGSRYTIGAQPKILLSQVEAEHRISNLFTWPYPVERVSDRAIELARKIFNNAIERLYSI